MANLITQMFGTGFHLRGHLPPIDFKGGDAVIWSMLALARLNRIIPTEADFFPQLDICILARGARFSLDKVIEAFRFGWVDLTVCSNLLKEFDETILACSTALNEEPTEEFEYLRAILHSFHAMLVLKQANGEDPTTESMLHQLTLRLQSEVFEPIIVPYLEEFESLMEPNRSVTEHMYSIRSHYDPEIKLLHAMQDFIKAHDDLGQVPRGGSYDRYHSSMASEIFNEFYDHANNQSFLHLEALKRSETQFERYNHTKAFMENIARFFTFYSPLLDPSGLDFDEMDEDENDEWQSPILTDLEDVLRGPETATVDDVSLFLPSQDNGECVICGETYEWMRRIHVCIHEFCENCLTEQLNTKHESRYKCALCRAEFFPDEEVLADEGV